MSKKIEVVIEDDELELLETIWDELDFDGQGYNDGKPENARSSLKIFSDFVTKIKDALP